MRMSFTRRLNGWLFALLVLIGAGAIGFLTSRHAILSDWTYRSRASVPPETRAILAKLDGPVDIVSYASPQGDLRESIATVLKRYQQVKPDLHLSFVDPQQDPTAMRNLGITVDGEMILHYRDREQRLEALTELCSPTRLSGSFAAAIASLRLSQAMASDAPMGRPTPI